MSAGLLDVSAHVAARVAGGSMIALFLLFAALATVSTWVLSIDTTALLLAPTSGWPRVIVVWLT